jgi:hypothetical protein
MADSSQSVDLDGEDSLNISEPKITRKGKKGRKDKQTESKEGIGLRGRSSTVASNSDDGN